MNQLQDNLRRFVFAGRAYFTLVNPETGIRLTFKIKMGKAEEPGACSRCRGTGDFRGRGGRVVGRCFACNGTGKTGASKPPFFVRWLTGADADDRAAYAYIGYVTQSDSEAAAPILRAGKSIERISADHVARKAFAWLLRHLDDLPAPAELHHEGRCGRCGRRLTDPTSIATGFGPECSGLLGVERVEPETETAVKAGIASVSDRQREVA